MRDGIGYPCFLITLKLDEIPDLGVVIGHTNDIEARVAFNLCDSFGIAARFGA